MDSPDPFTPGFGEFQGIPDRTLPDDCVEYTLFVLDAASARTRLETVKTVAEELAAEWAEGYIWQREGFSLELVEKTTEGRWCLQGRTEYGDSVDDEWFIVWMLRELSRRFTDLWIRVYDTDGEFLLIEAANALPKWLNPEIADHRVWLNSGNLLIIPLTASTTPQTTPISRPLTLPAALTSLTTHPPSRIRLLEEEAFYRTSHYPAAARSHLHHALCTVPRTIAHILHTHPSSIAAATEAFYLRDPISLKALTTPTRFPPKDLVTVSTTFTKVLYAQLKGQVFTPPPSAGWKPEDSGPADIGMKVTCGFEMLLSDLSVLQLSSRSRKATVEMLRGLLDVGVVLPGDGEIEGWEKTVDAEDWLEVEYEEFEDTLGGGKGGWGGADGGLKKMVERFEAFLNDDAGVEGVEFEDDMDGDDEEDEDEDGDDDDDEEDREVSFDEVEFEKMMREMMGMPGGGGVEDEEGEIRRMMERVEDELREAGALEIGARTGRIKEVEEEGDEDEEDDKDDNDDEEDDEVDIDYTLAANMLESFKGQGGLAGPGGNLLARMGIRVPRDEGERGKGRR